VSLPCISVLRLCRWEWGYEAKSLRCIPRPKTLPLLGTDCPPRRLHPQRWTLSCLHLPTVAQGCPGCPACQHPALQRLAPRNIDTRHTLGSNPASKKHGRSARAPQEAQQRSNSTAHETLRHTPMIVQPTARSTVSTVVYRSRRTQRAMVRSGSLDEGAHRSSPAARASRSSRRGTQRSSLSVSTACAGSGNVSSAGLHVARAARVCGAGLRASKPVGITGDKHGTASPMLCASPPVRAACRGPGGAASWACAARIGAGRHAAGAPRRGRPASA
jgi:hypothetical protein